MTDEQQAIVEENLPLIYYVAKKYRHVPEDVFQNIISRLHFRLCVCAQRFNPERQNRISSYIVACLKGEIKNYFRDESWIVRPPRPLREMSFSTAVDSLGDEVSAAELRGDNPQTIGSCAIPVPLHSFSSASREDDDYEIDIPSSENVESSIVDKVGGKIIVKEVFLALRIEERVVLALQMKRKSIKEVESRFQISRSEAAKVWNEVQGKARGLYHCALDGNTIVPSTGSIALKKAIRRKFSAELIGERNIQ